MKFLTTTVAVIAITFSLTGCLNGSKSVTTGVSSDGSEASSVRDNIVNTLSKNEEFDTLVSALKVTGLETMLADENKVFTVFGPTNAAFDELGQAKLNELFAEPETLKEILLYHVIPDLLVSSETAIELGGGIAEAANGELLYLSIEGSSILINEAKVVNPDILSTNGIIHGIDKVLLPASYTGEGQPSGNTLIDLLQSMDNFSILVGLLNATGFNPELKSAAASKGFAADDTADTVVTSTADGNDLSIVDVLNANGLTTMASAIEDAGLVDVLSDSSQQFTVFAPSNAAFDAMGAVDLNLMFDNKDALKTVTLGHVIADTVVDKQAAVSLLGQQLESMAGGEMLQFIAPGGDHLYVNNALLEISDIEASNGVVHVIDAIIEKEF